MPEPTKAPQAEENPYLKMMQEDAPQAEAAPVGAANSAPGAEPGYWDRLTNPVGSGAAEQGILGGARQIGGQAIKTIAQPFIHPIDTAKSLYHTYADPLPSLRGPAPKTLAEFSPETAQFVEGFKKNPALTLENAAGTGLGMFEGGRMAAGLGEAAPKTLEYIRPRSSPDVVPPIEAHAERLGQSILPPGGLTPKLLESIRYEAPSIREFAQRTGNPLKTQAEGLKAAQGVGSEGVTHFNENFLKPNADTQVQLPNNVSPSLGHVATLEQINSRIGEINDLERATAGKSEGATMTAQERLGLQGEAKALRQKLYETLSQRTGVSPDDIRNMREGYGGQYTVANALESARMGRLDRIGKSEQGQNPLNVPRSVMELPNIIWTGLKGGEEAIANRQFASRIRRFSPEAPTRPMPNPDMHPLPAYSEDELRGFIKPKK